MASFGIPKLRPMAPNYTPLIDAAKGMQDANKVDNAEMLGLVKSGADVLTQLYTIQYNNQLEQAKLDLQAAHSQLNDYAQEDVAKGAYTVKENEQSSAEQELGKPKSYGLELSGDFQDRANQLRDNLQTKYEKYPSIQRLVLDEFNNSMNTAHETATLDAYKKEYSSLMVAGKANLDESLQTSVAQGSSAFWKTQLASMKGWLSPGDFSALNAEYQQKYDTQTAENEYINKMFTQGLEPAMDSVRKSGLSLDKVYSVSARLSSLYHDTERASADQIQQVTDSLQKQGTDAASIRDAVSGLNVPQVFKQPAIDHWNLVHQITPALALTQQGDYAKADEALSALKLDDTQAKEASAMIKSARATYETASQAKSNDLYSRAVKEATANGGLSSARASQYETAIPNYSKTGEYTKKILDLVPKGTGGASGAGPISSDLQNQLWGLVWNPNMGETQKRSLLLQLHQKYPAVDLKEWGGRIHDNNPLLSEIGGYVDSFSTGSGATMDKSESASVKASMEAVVRQHPEMDYGQLKKVADDAMSVIKDKKFSEAVNNLFSWKGWLGGTHTYEAQMREIQPLIQSGTLAEVLGPEQADQASKALAAEQARELATTIGAPITGTFYDTNGQATFSDGGGNQYRQVLDKDGNLVWQTRQKRSAQWAMLQNRS